jgi:hypothetical protein
MKDCGSKKGYELFLSADLYGTGIAQLGWNHREEEMEVIDVQAMRITGRMIETSKRQNVCTFDGWIEGSRLSRLLPAQHSLH